MLWRVYLEMFCCCYCYIINKIISVEPILPTSVAQFQSVCLFLSFKFLTNLIFNWLHPFLIECATTIEMELLCLSVGDLLNNNSSSLHCLLQYVQHTLSGTVAVLSQLSHFIVNINNSEILFFYINEKILHTSAWGGTHVQRHLMLSHTGKVRVKK